MPRICRWRRIEERPGPTSQGRGQAGEPRHRDVAQTALHLRQETLGETGHRRELAPGEAARGTQRTNPVSDDGEDGIGTGSHSVQYSAGTIDLTHYIAWIRTR